MKGADRHLRAVPSAHDGDAPEPEPFGGDAKPLLGLMGYRGPYVPRTPVLNPTGIPLEELRTARTNAPRVDKVCGFCGCLFHDARRLGCTRRCTIALRSAARVAARLLEADPDPIPDTKRSPAIAEALRDTRTTLQRMRSA